MRKKINIYYILLIIISSTLLILIDKTGPFFQFCEYSDVNIYYEIGKALDNGKVLYKEIFDTKGPYMFFLGFLSYKFFYSYTLFFLLNLFSLIITTICCFEILKRENNEKESFILSIIVPILCCAFFNNNGCPEFIYIGIISLFLYWILTNGFSKKNNKQFILFGIFFSFIFFTKINYLLGFVIVAIYYIFLKIKDKKYDIVLKEIGFFILGLLIGYSPICFYEIHNCEIFFITKTYILNAIKYSNDTHSSIKSLIKVLVMFLLLMLFFIYKNKERYKKQELYSIVLFLIGTEISIFLTRRLYHYYLYILLPFIIIALQYIIKISKKEKLLIKILLFSSLTILYLISFINKNNEKDLIGKHQLLFYEDYKDVITEDTLILGLFNINTIVTHYFDCQPSYKYFVTLNNSYDSFSEIYDEYYNKIESKNFDYIIILSEKDGKPILCPALSIKIEYVKETYNCLLENYKLEKTYYYDNNKNISVYTKM